MKKLALAAATAAIMGAGALTAGAANAAPWHHWHPWHRVVPFCVAHPWAPPCHPHRWHPHWVPPHVWHHHWHYL